MKGEYFVVEQKPSMSPPHNKYHLKYGKMLLASLTNLGHGPVTYLDVR